jgi:hypothetical protein
MMIWQVQYQLELQIASTNIGRSIICKPHVYGAFRDNDPGNFNIHPTIYVFHLMHNFDIILSFIYLSFMQTCAVDVVEICECHEKVGQLMMAS